MCLILHSMRQSCNVLFASKCVMRLYRLLCVHPRRWSWLRLPSCQCVYSALLQQACRQIEEKWFIVRLTFFSLFYNSLTSSWTIVDTMLEPMFWFVNHFIHYLGPIFVVMIVLLVTFVVVITYICILPVKLSHSVSWVVYHFVVGHWLLVNIVFHYFKAAFTNPGHVPENITVVASICKKCIAPRPPRAHHCSVCHRCILKMDHHCPWLNNCVGHHNHRHFFLFCVYMCIGCFYVSLSGYPLFKEHFYGVQDGGWSGILYPLELISRFVNYIVSLFQNVFGVPSEPEKPPKSTSAHPAQRNTDGLRLHHLMAFQFLLCTSAFLALAGLTVWHARLIHFAETSIESHTNRQEAARQHKLGLKYRNPYNFGGRQNWRIFLGLTNGRSFWRHVLLPSSHPPDGNGLVWRMVHERNGPLKEIAVL